MLTIAPATENVETVFTAAQLDRQGTLQPQNLKAQVKTEGYDASGTTTGYGSDSFTLNQRGRLVRPRDRGGVKLRPGYHEKREDG
jgi:hypothetical protein